VVAASGALRTWFLLITCLRLILQPTFLIHDAGNLLKILNFTCKVANTAHEAIIKRESGLEKLQPTDEGRVEFGAQVGINTAKYILLSREARIQLVRLPPLGGHWPHFVYSGSSGRGMVSSSRSSSMGKLWRSCVAHQFVAAL